MISHHRSAHGQHYVESGQGDAVVLLHGWPQSWYCWRHIIPGLSVHHRVVAPDLRGLGDSADPGEGYRKRDIAQDVAQLMAELGESSYHVVGHDWGGVVAWALAAHHPACVRTLAIVDVAIPGDGDPDISQGGRRWHHAFHQTPALPEALISGQEALYLGWFYDNYGASAEAIDDEDKKEYLRTYSQPERLRAGFEYYRALPLDAADNAAVIERGRLTLPVLAVGGGESFGRGNQVEQSLRRTAWNVFGEVIPGAGHWVPEEEPEMLKGLLLAHFERH